MQEGQQRRDELVATLTPLVEGVGCSLVELNLIKRKGRFRAHAVIASSGVTDLNACTIVYRAIYGKLALLLGERDLHLEVFSPGIRRVVKSPREYKIFQGAVVQILLVGETDWISGRIVESGEGRVEIVRRGERVTLNWEEIRKAKFDFTQGGEGKSGL